MQDGRERQKQREFQELDPGGMLVLHMGLGSAEEEVAMDEVEKMSMKEYQKIGRDDTMIFLNDIPNSLETPHL